MNGLTAPPSKLIQAIVHECILVHGEDSEDFRILQAHIAYVKPFNNDVDNKIDERV